MSYDLTGVLLLNKEEWDMVVTLFGETIEIFSKNN